MPHIRIRQEGPSVHIIVDGKLAIDAPWNAAIDIARELMQRARLAEECAKANDIIFDQAILARTGAAFGLSDNKDIQHEAMKEASHNPILRRHIPGGIQSQEAVGVPVIYRG